MPSLLDINPVVYAAGAGGIPSTASPISLRGQIESYEDTIAVGFGFESARASFVCSFDEAVMWLGRLMDGLTTYGPDAETIWDGVLVAAEARFGQEVSALSLDDLANHVRARYTTVLGTPGTTVFVSDAVSIARYGTHNLILELGKTDAAAALNKATQKLIEMKNPRKQPSAEAATGDLGGVQVDLTFAGWAEMLKRLTTSSTSVTSTSTTAQVITLLTAYCAVNPFFDTSAANVAASGITDTEFIEPDTTYFDKIVSLLAKGNSANQRLAWGIYEGRRLTVKEWAGATPGTISYYRHLGDHAIRDAGGGEIMPWNVRPDAMHATVDLLDSATVASAADSPGRFYVERRTFSASASGIGVRCEPQTSSALDAQLARIP